MTTKKTKIKYLNVGDKTIPYIILNKSNKNTYFRFKEDYLEVSKSKHVKEDYIINYLTNNFNDFYTKYLKVLKKIPKNNEIILEGKSYELVIEPKNSFSYNVIENKIIVNTKMKDIDKIKRKIYQLHLEQMIKLIEANDTKFCDIISMNLIDKVNYMISKDTIDDITIYTEYIIEMLLILIWFVKIVCLLLTYHMVMFYFMLKIIKSQNITTSKKSLMIQMYYQTLK